jgi:hypothetical protein
VNVGEDGGERRAHINILDASGLRWRNVIRKIKEGASSCARSVTLQRVGCVIGVRDNFSLHLPWHGCCVWVKGLGCFCC